MEYIKYAENWQVISVICSYAAMACDIFLIIAMIVLYKYRKTMQVILAAFLQMNTKNTGIQSVQADQIGRTYPLLFTLNLPKEDEIIDDLKEITAIEYVVQVIMIIGIYSSCNYCHIFLLHKMQAYSYYIQILFPVFTDSNIVHMSHRTDLFVEVTNITKGNGIWAHFTLTRCFPSQIQMLRLIQKEDVQI